MRTFALFFVLVTTLAAGPPKGKLVWKADFENGDCFPEISNFGRDVAETVNGQASSHVDITWQRAVVHSGTYAEREHTTRDPDLLGKYASHRGYCFQSWISTNGRAVPTPIVVTAWIYLEKFDSEDWLSFITLISALTEGYPAGSILTLDMTPSMELTVWCQPKHQQGTAFVIQPSGPAAARMPLKRWVKLQVYADWNGPDGAIKVWKDDDLVIDAPKRDIGPASALEKGHFGLYAGPNLNEITMYNDDLSVETVSRLPPTARN
jgi:hypothetical protein